MSNQEQDDLKEIKNLVSRLLESNDRISDRVSITFEEIRTEIQEIKDTRYRPYITSVGLFAVVTLAATSYIYNLETKITMRMFELSNRIAKNESGLAVNKEQVATNDQRSKSRAERDIRDLDEHRRDHIKDDERTNRIADELLEHLKARKKHVDHN